MSKVVKKMYLGGTSSFGYGQFGFMNQSPQQFFGTNPYSMGSSYPTTITSPSVTTGGGDTSFLSQGFKGRSDAISGKMGKAGVTDKMVNQIANTVTQGADMAQGALENGVTNSKGYDTIKKIGNMKTGNAVIDAGKAVAMMSISAMNRWGGQESDAFYADRQLQETMGNSYTGSFEDINEAEQGNKFYGMFSFGKMKKQNENAAKQEEIQTQLQDINEEAQAQYAAANNVQTNNMKYLNKINGIDFSEFSLSAKNGIKLEHLNRVKQLKNKHFINLDTKRVEEFKQGGIIEQPTTESEWMPVITDPVDSFKNGGVLEDEWVPIITDPVEIFKDGGKTEENELVKLEETNQKNIIPEGALHKNKHHIENTEGLTQKGIPVIDNNGEQQAEIELDEIIFTLEVTKKLEELHKKYKDGDEQAAVEAGRLLVQEILYNTDDRTGLIAKCQKGGKLNGNIE